MTQTVDDSIITGVIDSYSRLNMMMEPLRLQVWENHQITITQLRVMHLIRQHVEPSVRELAIELKISGPTMSGLLDRLIQRGVAERRHDDVDRRVVRVRLTGEGQDVLGIIERSGKAALTAAFERIGADATARMGEDFAMLADAVHEVVEEQLPRTE